jgi:hypothetical protein
MAVVGHGTEITTERGLQDRARCIRAMGVLGKAPAYYWLIPTPDEMQANARRLRFTVLAELGRVEDDGDLKEWAKLLCEEKPKAREAVARVRAWRLGRPAKGNALDLTFALTGFVKDWCDRHPEVTVRTVLLALENVADAFREEEGPA